MEGLFVCALLAADGTCASWVSLPGTFEIDPAQQGIAFLKGFALLTPVFLALLAYKLSTKALRA